MLGNLPYTGLPVLLTQPADSLRRNTFTLKRRSLHRQGEEAKKRAAEMGHVPFAG
jgi:hypothetical protein